jgi:rare lipoprotein A (peptidoglycan hydrolase)
VVQVCVDKRVCVMTVLNDWCQCFDKRLIDLDARDFARLAPLSQGLVNVEVEW